jgi:hypothetical protein
VAHLLGGAEEDPLLVEAVREIDDLRPAGH